MIPKNTVLISQRIKVYTPQYPDGTAPPSIVYTEYEIPAKGEQIAYPPGKEPMEIIPPKP